MKHLLIISCSNKKSETSGLLPAYERYTGYNFQIMKKIIREQGTLNDIDILILSALYGMIEWNHDIPYYDKMMLTDHVSAMQTKVRQQLQDFFHACTYQYDEFLVNMGKVYRQVLEVYPIQNHCRQVSYSEGGIGQKGSQMKKWILEKVN